MKKLFSNKSVLIAVIALVVLVVLAFLSAGSRTIPWLESTIGDIVRPIQTFATDVSNAIADFFADIFNTTDTDLENARLQQQLALYEQTMVDYAELKEENERLRQLLNYSDTFGEYEYVTASVIGRSNGVWFDVITINAGRNQGIELDMPVICGDGLVGKVTDLGANWCKVTSIIDSTITVATMIERTRDNCMVRGVMSATNDSSELELYYLPTDLTDLVPGDIVITSGIGGLYPKGLLVGTVKEVMLDSESSGVNAIISTSVDFLHLEEVMVITDFGGAAE